MSQKPKPKKVNYKPPCFKSKTVLNLAMIALFMLAPLIVTPKNSLSHQSAGTIPNAGQSADPPLVVGLTRFPVSPDCHASYDLSAVPMFMQYADGLYKTVKVGQEMTTVPNLADGFGTWNPSGTELTISLRQDVLFHDNTYFDAEAVLWNFNRIEHLFELGYNETYDIFHPFDDVPVIQNISIVEESTIKFTLNYPFASFREFLAFETTFMLSPESTPYDRPMEFGLGDVPVGTGPFEVVDYTEGYEIRFQAHPNYHFGAPQFHSLTLRYFAYSFDATIHLLSGEVHLVPELHTSYLPDLYSSFEFNATGAQPSMTTYFLGFNTEKVPQIWRQAFSFAIDYDFMDLPEFEYREPATNPVAPGVPHRLPEIMPKTNITHARHLILTDPTLGPLATARGLTNLSADGAWEDVAENTPLDSFNFTCADTQNLWDFIGTALQADFALLGVDLVKSPLPYEDYVNLLYSHVGNGQNTPDLFMSGWIVDYLSPLSAIYYLKNDSMDNIFNYNDSTFQNLLFDAETTIDSGAREQKYYDMQEYLINVSVPVIPMQYKTVHSGWNVYLQGFSPNGLNRLDLYDCTWDPPEPYEGEPPLIGGNFSPEIVLVIILIIVVMGVVAIISAIHKNQVITAGPQQEARWTRSSAPQTFYGTSEYASNVPFCRECGTQLDPREIFCSQCGTRRLD